MDDVWCPFLYALQQTATFRMVEFRNARDDVAFAKSEIIPPVESGVHLKEASLSSLSGDLYQRLLPCCLMDV